MCPFRLNWGCINRIGLGKEDLRFIGRMEPVEKLDVKGQERNIQKINK